MQYMYDAIEVRCQRSRRLTGFQQSLGLQLSVVYGILRKFERYAIQKLKDMFYLYSKTKKSHLFPGAHYDENNYGIIDLVQTGKCMQRIKDDIRFDLFASPQRLIQIFDS